MIRKIARYGWRPSLPDHRDFKLKDVERPLYGGYLPSKVSLRGATPVLDQGQIGTCVANSNADMYLFVLQKEAQSSPFLPSRLYIYAKGRELEGTPLSQDSGMEVRDALKVLAAGAPPEAAWPYSDANPGPFDQEPPTTLNASSHAINYYSIQPGHASLRSCLAAGYPFTFGFSVPPQLESPEMASGQTKLLAQPDANTQFIGGHGVECIGYDFSCTTFHVPVFEIKNSWGSSWCDNGHFFMDWRFFNALATDIWTLRSTN